MSFLGTKSSRRESRIIDAGDDLIDGFFECAFGYVGADSDAGRVCVPYTPMPADCGDLDQPPCTGAYGVRRKLHSSLPVLDRTRKF